MKKILPPVLFAFSLVAMVLANRYLPGSEIIPPILRLASVVTVPAGIAILMAGRLQFRRQRTNVFTFDEPGSLVTDGVFRLSRHPMYLGFALVLLGAALHFGSVTPFVPFIMFVVIADRWYIAFEERWLRAKFGIRYEQYAQSTRRWL